MTSWEQNVQHDGFMFRSIKCLSTQTLVSLDPYYILCEKNMLTAAPAKFFSGGIGCGVLLNHQPVVRLSELHGCCSDITEGAGPALQREQSSPT